MVVLLLVDDEEEDVAVEEEREVIYSNCQIVCGIGLATTVSSGRPDLRFHTCPPNWITYA